MKKKGFTLVELLAVVVILTIVILITIPKIAASIEAMRKEAFKNNVLNLFEAVKKLESNSDFQLDENGINYNDKRLNLPNNPFTGGRIVLDANGKMAADQLTDAIYCAAGTKQEINPIKGKNCDLKSALTNIKFVQYPATQKWQTGKRITIKIDEFENYPYTFEFSIDKGKTYHKITSEETPLIFGEYDGTSAKEFFKNTYGQEISNNLDTVTMIIRVSYLDADVKTTYQITMVDSTAPTDIGLNMVMRSTSSICLRASATEKESYISKYEFSIDGGSYVNNGTSGDKCFTNVTQGDHNVKVKVTNVVGLSAETSRTFKPAVLNAPEFASVVGVSESKAEGWYKQKKVTIKYPMDRDDLTESAKNVYTYKYKVFGSGGEGSTNFIEFPESQCTVQKDSVGDKYCLKEITLNNDLSSPNCVNNCFVAAEVESNGNVERAPNLTVDHIDPVVPTIASDAHYFIGANHSLAIFTAGDTHSGIWKTMCSNKTTPGTTDWVDNGTSTTCTFNDTNLGSGSATSWNSTERRYHIKVIDKAGNEHTSYKVIPVKNNKITMTEQVVNDHTKNVKIVYPLMGDISGITYKYSVNGGSSWTETTSTSVTTPNITENNTNVLATICHNGDCYVNQSIKVNADTTPPTCSWSGESTSWTKGSRTITATGSDGAGMMSGASSCSWTYSSTTQTATPSCVVKDRHGNATTCSKTVNVYVDTTAPACGTVSGQSTSWTNGNRTISGAGSDAHSGYKSGGSTTYSSTTKTATFSWTVTDNAGNTKACSSSVNVYVDKTAPSCGSASGGSTSWTSGNRTISGSGSDSDSGVKSGGSTTYSSTTKTATFSWTVTDNAGNTKSCSSSVNVYVDKTAPSCGSTSEGSSGTSVKGTVACSDSHSGCVKSSYSDTYTSNGTKSITIKDNAGNSKSCSVKITNVCTAPTVGSRSGDTGGTTQCNTAVTSSKTCKIHKAAITKSGSLTSSSYVKANVGGSGSATRYYNDRTINYWIAYFSSSYFSAGNSSTRPTITAAKVCTSCTCASKSY